MPKVFDHVYDEDFMEQWGHLTKKDLLEKIYYIKNDEWIKREFKEELKDYRDTNWFKLIVTITIFFAIFGFLEFFGIELPPAGRPDNI